MADQTWTGETEKAAQTYFQGLGTVERLKEVWRPWKELAGSVREFLSAEALRALPGSEVYARLVSLFEARPRVRGRFKSLIAFHDGERLKEALLRLVTTPEQGDPGRRIDAMKLGGIGRATASELLCLWWPYRFLPQNAASSAGLARLVPVYRRRELADLPYDVFMDFASTLEGAFRAQAVARWPEVAEEAKDSRYLHFYAFLSEL